MPDQTLAPTSPVTRDGVNGYTPRYAAALVVGLLAAIGLGMIAWFLVTLARPTKLIVPLGAEREIVVAAYGGQVYLASRDLRDPQPYVIAWEMPWGLKPAVWEPHWLAADRSGDRYFGGSLPALSLVPLMPAVVWLIARTLRRRRLRGTAGFAVVNAGGDDRTGPTPL